MRRGSLSVRQVAIVRELRASGDFMSATQLRDRVAPGCTPDLIRTLIYKMRARRVAVVIETKIGKDGGYRLRSMSDRVASLIGAEGGR